MANNASVSGGTEGRGRQSQEDCEMKGATAGVAGALPPGSAAQRLESPAAGAGGVAATADAHLAAMPATPLGMPPAPGSRPGGTPSTSPPGATPRPTPRTRTRSSTAAAAAATAAAAAAAAVVAGSSAAAAALTTATTAAGTSPSPGPGRQPGRTAPTPARKATANAASPAPATGAASSGPSGSSAPRGVPEKLGDQPLRLIITGHNPSAHAWQSGHYYSNPSNHMWRILIATGIAPPGTRGPQDDGRLPPEAGVGFLDVGCGHPGTDSSSFPSHVFEGWSRAYYARLKAHMARASASIGCSCGKCGAPCFVAFSGKRQYLELLNVGRSGKHRVKTVEWGPQSVRPTGWPFPPSTQVWVCSSTSGAAALSRDQREGPYRRLAEALRAVEWPRRVQLRCAQRLQQQQQQQQQEGAAGQGQEPVAGLQAAGVGTGAAEGAGDEGDAEGVQGADGLEQERKRDEGEEENGSNSSGTG